MVHIASGWVQDWGETEISTTKMGYRNLTRKRCAKRKRQQLGWLGDGRAAGIGVGGAESENAPASLGECAGARDDAVQGQGRAGIREDSARAGEVDRELIDA